MDANNIYCYTLRQKLQYKEFSFTEISLDEVLKSSDVSDYEYWVMYDIKNRDKCKDNTRCLQLLTLNINIEKNELGYRQKKR